MYNAFIISLKNVRKHPNADKLQLATCFGETIIISADHCEGELGIYFPSDGQISVEFATANNLLRSQGGYLEDDKRNIKPLKLRQVKSDGLWLPLSSLSSFTDISTLKEGDQITVLNGTLICQKYIPRGKMKGTPSAFQKKKKDKLTPLFKEHIDTLQLRFCVDTFSTGDLIQVTLKMHRSSQRTAFFPTFRGYRRSWLDRLLRRKGEPIYDWGYTTGTRRVERGAAIEENFPAADIWRLPHAKHFEGKLQKGETVYYEVVGYMDEQKTIMPSGSNKNPMLDKDFVKKYGDTTIFHYGCTAGESDIYVYRITLTNEDGYVTEYSPAQIALRCEQMGVKTVPQLDLFFVPDGADIEAFLLEKAEQLGDGDDPVGKTHIREGVIFRNLSKANFAVAKWKNYSFKVLEGIIKESAEAPDVEEAQEGQEG